MSDYISKCCRACCKPFCCCCFKSQSTPQKYACIEYKPVADPSSDVKVPPMSPFIPDSTQLFPQKEEKLWPQHLQLSPSSVDPYRRQSQLLTAPTPVKVVPPKRTSTLPSIAHSSFDDSDKPMLTFSVMYDIQSGILYVTLKFATNLESLLPPKALMSKISTASVSIYLLPNKKEIMHAETDVRTTNPVFNKTVQFDGILVGKLEWKTLVFELYYNRALIGTVKLPLKDADLLGYTVCKHIERSSEHSEVMYSSYCRVYLPILEVTYSVQQLL